MSSYPYGNYKNYYPRRRAKNNLPANRDERLALIVKGDQDFFKGKSVLDVGCNVGAVSVEIAQRHGASHVTGVDIDSTLISQCQYTIRAAYSLQAPSKNLPLTRNDESIARSSYIYNLDDDAPGPSEKKRRKLGHADAVDDSVAVKVEPEPRFDYFPSCFPAIYGLLPLPPISDTLAAKSGRLPFPRNVSFIARDWMDEKSPPEVETYDIILALSITKWIHLHTLDPGIVAFFRKTFERLGPGGRLVLDRQGWAGYKGAKRGSAKLKANYLLLKLRPETDFERILLEEVGYERRTLVRGAEAVAGGKEGFDRVLEVYYKPG